MRWGCSFPCALLFFLLLGWWGQSSGFKTCAFTLQNFNSTKALNKRVMYTLKRVVARCDICLLLDVKDPQGSVVNKFVTSLNRDTDSYGDAYVAVSSDNLGTHANNMQRFVFLYRSGQVSVTKYYQFQSKSFARPPLVVQFNTNKTRVEEFVLVAVNTEPSQAVKEMDKLYEVSQDISKKWKTETVMFLGNFNADCGHMTRSNKKDIRLFDKKKFYWLIGDHVDTTTTDTTDCAYDRIVVQGKSFLKHIEPGTAGVFNFAKQFQLSKQEAMHLSDHRPIEVDFKSSSNLPRATPLLIFLSLSAIVSSGLSAL